MLKNFKLREGGKEEPQEELQGMAPALVARQPVFDQHDRVWGYELLFRDPSLQPGLAGKSSDVATSTVMIDGFELMRPMLRSKQRFLINFTQEFLEAELPAVLPPEVCAIEILESVYPTETVLQGLMNLKKQGYVLALDDYIGQKEMTPFLSIVDIIKVDVLGMTPDEITRIAAFLSPYSAQLLAEKVEDRATADLCRSQGFSLFQGYFFSKAEVIWGKKLNPSQVSKARLLALTANTEPDLQQIVQAISADVYLTYKLLKYINSLYFGLPTQVQSIEHAVKLLGTQKIRQWLCVTALADMDAAPMSQEIVYTSALRAKFLEILAEKCSGCKLNGRDFPSKLFITGLFSLLESLLRVPLKDIFSSIPLDDDVLRVLCEGDGPLALWYQLMTYYEKGQWEEVQKVSRHLGINDFDLASAYIEAGKWSTALFDIQGTSAGQAPPKNIPARGDREGMRQTP